MHHLPFILLLTLWWDRENSFDMVLGLGVSSLSKRYFLRAFDDLEYEGSGLKSIFVCNALARGPYTVRSLLAGPYEED